MHLIQCYVCAQTFPEGLVQEHHKRPQAAGGTDGEVINLCSGCHHNTHRIADMLIGKKALEAPDTIKLTYSDRGAQERCWELASIVAEWMRGLREGNVQPNGEASVPVLLPIEVKAALTMMGNEVKGPLGRRLGVSGLLRHLACEAAYKRYPQLRSKVMERLRTDSVKKM